METIIFTFLACFVFIFIFALLFNDSGAPLYQVFLISLLFGVVFSIIIEGLRWLFYTSIIINPVYEVIFLGIVMLLDGLCRFFKKKGIIEEEVNSSESIIYETTEDIVETKNKKFTKLLSIFEIIGSIFIVLYGLGVF